MPRRLVLHRRSCTSAPMPTKLGNIVPEQHSTHARQSQAMGSEIEHTHECATHSCSTIADVCIVHSSQGVCPQPT